MAKRRRGETATDEKRLKRHGNRASHVDLVWIQVQTNVSKKIFSNSGIRQQERTIVKWIMALWVRKKQKVQINLLAIHMNMLMS